MVETTGKVKIEIEHTGQESFRDMAAATKPAVAEAKNLEGAVDAVGRAEAKVTAATQRGVSQRISAYRREQQELTKLARKRAAGIGKAAAGLGAAAGAVGALASATGEEGGDGALSAFGRIAGSTSSGALTGASIGMIGGPKGALIGGAAGGIAGLGKGIYNEFTRESASETREKEEAAKKQLESAKLLKEAAEELKQLGSVVTGDPQERLAISEEIRRLSEALRTGTPPAQQTGPTAEARDWLIEQAKTRDAIERQTAILQEMVDTGRLSQEQMREMLGNTSAHTKRLDVLETATYEEVRAAMVGASGSMLQ